MVLVEAMSKGLPIVSFDCPTGPREVVHTGQNGFLVPDRDQAGLAQAMLELIRDREARVRMGAGAADEAARYSLDVIGPRWDALIGELVGEATPADRSASVAARSAA
jgi:glycosyltransferase involved in cell wall biosynthesis